jgi:alpha-galactosidase/6-phospho-beta-glucosidase family protein
VKICVVGGGSTYTPELVDGILRRRDRLPASELVLLDPDHERLEIVGCFAADALLTIEAALTGDRSLAEAALMTNALGPDASLPPRVWERLRTHNDGLFGKLDG